MKSKAIIAALGTLIVALVVGVGWQITGIVSDKKTENEIPFGTVSEYTAAVNDALNGRRTDFADIAYPELEQYLKSLGSLSGDLDELPFSRPLIRINEIHVDSEFWAGQKPVYHTGNKDSISGEKLRHTKGMTNIEGSKSVIAFRGKGTFRENAKGGEVDYRFVAVVAREASSEKWRVSSVLPYSATGEKAVVRP